MKIIIIKKNKTVKLILKLLEAYLENCQDILYYMSKLAFIHRLLIRVLIVL